MKKSIILSILFSIVSTSVFAQNYNNPPGSDDNANPPAPLPLPPEVDPTQPIDPDLGIAPPAEQWDGILVQGKVFWSSRTNNNCKRLGDWNNARRTTSDTYVIFVGKEFTCDGHLYILARVMDTSFLKVVSIGSLELNPEKYPN